MMFLRQKNDILSDSIHHLSWLATLIDVLYFGTRTKLHTVVQCTCFRDVEFQIMPLIVILCNSCTWSKFGAESKKSISVPTLWNSVTLSYMNLNLHSNLLP